MTDIELLNQVREKFQLKNNTQLASFCGLDGGLVRGVMQSKRSLGPLAKLRVADRLGYVWARDALLNLFPEDIAVKARSADNQRVSKNARTKSTPNKEKLELPKPVDGDTYW
ncbi:MAG: hypothetical protein ABL985_12020 [Casimicrobium sp.]